MASARKKQDEKHLKILRDLVSNPQNRQCFDCHQRGPTYVNMTIGSFVCTSCSGLLRGLTPPHRVKSISMATFSPEEIELISSRGNEYCRRIWLGLYDQGRVTDARDEQGIKDFMISKYEKKRYYLDPSMANMNGLASSVQISGSVTPTSQVTSSNSAIPPVRPLTSLVGSITLPVLSSFSQPPSSNQNAFTPDGPTSGFLVDFNSMSASGGPTSLAKADPFGPAVSSGTKSSNISNFADFENNPIFDAPNGIPVSSSLTTSQSFPGVSRKSSSGSGSMFQPPPSEDRYAALKDLDSLMKSQHTEQVTPTGNTQSDWGQSSSTSSSWAAFGSSPQRNTFLGSSFPAENNTVSIPSNPFTGSTNPWSVADNTVANPFLSGQQAQADRPSQFPWGVTSTGGGVNGTSVNGFHSAAPSFPSSQSITFPVKSWNTEPTGNPFTVGSSSSSGSHSHNPFL